MAYSTVRTYLSAVRHLHISQGLGVPVTGRLQLELALKGYRKQKLLTQDARLPITPLVLKLIRRVLTQEAQKYENVMFWAVCCLGFFAFLRSGEMTVQSRQAFDPTWDLTCQDIAIDNPEVPTLLQITVKGSKTDQLRQGIHLFVGRTACELCPVAAVLSFLALRGQSPGPLFCFQDGRPLTRQILVTWLKETLRRAGVDATRYSGHSFRIGAATTAAARGIPDSTIQALGRWNSDSFKRYIRIPRKELADISCTLVLGCK